MKKSLHPEKNLPISHSYTNQAFWVMNAWKTCLKAHLYTNFKLRADVLNNSPGTGPRNQNPYII